MPVLGSCSTVTAKNTTVAAILSNPPALPAVPVVNLAYNCKFIIIYVEMSIFPTNLAKFEDKKMGLVQLNETSEEKVPSYLKHLGFILEYTHIFAIKNFR